MIKHRVLKIAGMLAFERLSPASTNTRGKLGTVETKKCSIRRTRQHWRPIYGPQTVLQSNTIIQCLICSGLMIDTYVIDCYRNCCMEAHLPREDGLKWCGNRPKPTFRKEKHRQVSHHFSHKNKFHRGQDAISLGSS